MENSKTSAKLRKREKNEQINRGEREGGREGGRGDKIQKYNVTNQILLVVIP